MPRNPGGGYALVCRETHAIVSRHRSLDYARAAWRARAYPGGNTSRPLTPWARRHFIIGLAMALAQAPSEDVA
ncbi:hypothetical protein MKK68_21130 [Methylobacterium sp. E-016]|uniref:hypothetical protein n=1 Tax=Methylobacterium sp. E-016 TaxID=2836556 RepID=UPI001FBBBEAF|nr:hypothetical protein [Methylobacterium sp. E-016]MCJ2078117.1 hypothetical protein [Methylobacterium sp. E-016]